MPEIQRILDQLVRASEGDAWHGPPVSRVLQGIDAAAASARPLPHAHSIWELALHIAAWEDVVWRRLGGEVIGELPPERDWPAAGAGPSEWQRTVAELEAGNRRLREAVSRFPEERLVETVPGRDYTFYVMLHGIVQHDLYHAGQIALLKTAAARP
jgi:uncharacterized damage-inducible protein DinB